MDWLRRAQGGGGQRREAGARWRDGRRDRADDGRDGGREGKGWGSDADPLQCGRFIVASPPLEDMRSVLSCVQCAGMGQSCPSRLAAPPQQVHAPALLYSPCSAHRCHRRVPRLSMALRAHFGRGLSHARARVRAAFRSRRASLGAVHGARLPCPLAADVRGAALCFAAHRLSGRFRRMKHG